MTWSSTWTVVTPSPRATTVPATSSPGVIGADTTNYEYSVLARLSGAPDRSLRLSTLAAQCDSTQPRLSKVMVRFEQRGWVTRSPDPDNGRYTLATLTDAGLQKVVRSAPGHVDRVRELVFDPLSAAQQRTLGAALARIAGPVREQLDARAAPPPKPVLDAERDVRPRGSGADVGCDPAGNRRDGDVGR